MLVAYATQDIRRAEAVAAQRAPMDGLMKKAAGAVADACAGAIIDCGQQIPQSVVMGLVGGGDNGGDCLYALSYLADLGASCVAVVTASSPHRRALKAAKAAGVEVVQLDTVVGAGGDDGLNNKNIDSQVEGIAGQIVQIARRAGVWIDGLVGTGAKGPLRQPLAQIVAALIQERRTSPDEPIVVAVDLPSGMEAPQGVVSGPYLPADITVTMGGLKPELLAPPACYDVGRVELVDLDLEIAGNGKIYSLTASDVADNWPLPGRFDHKYTRGVVQIVAGSRAYPLTGVMCLEGAARSGAGMVRFSGPDEAALAVLSRLPEAVTKRGKYQSLLVGPGIDRSDSQRVAQAVSLARQAQRLRLAMVIDAGALELWPQICADVPDVPDVPNINGGSGGADKTIRAGNESLLPSGGAVRADSPANLAVSSGALPRYLQVLTPHAGEAARLLGQLYRGSMAISRHMVEQAPVVWAQKLAQLSGATVVLKGGSTVICSPRSEACYVDSHSPAWAGTAGSGDVLAGVISAVLAGRQAALDAAGGVGVPRNVLSAPEVAQAAATGVWLHAQACRIAAGISADRLLGRWTDCGHPVVATDIARAVPEAIALALSS